MNNTVGKINGSIINKWKEKYDLKWMRPISHEQYRDAQNGKYDFKLTPVKDMPKEWLKDVKGKKVLGLAAGGGQQMAILSALGAECTLLDISTVQLEQDKIVSERERYSIKLLQGDMSERLPFEDETFDYVINPISFLYIENVKNVFKEIYRVLKKNGTYLGGFDNGFYWIFDDDEKTVVRSLPFDPLKDKKLYDDLMDNDMGLQFSHTLEEEINGQLEAGFILESFYEDYNPEGFLTENNVPTFFATKARK